MKGDLIGLTGLDGSGKTTQVHKLAEKLPKYKIVWARYKPFLLAIPIKFFNKSTLKNKKVTDEVYNKFTKRKRNIFKNKFYRKLYFTLSFIDYYSQIFFKVNLPIFFGKNIILDRYFYDYFIDLSLNFGLADEEIKQLFKKPFLKLFKKPRIMFLLDIAPKESLQREDDPNVPNINYLEERRNKYLLIAKINNINILDGKDSIEKVNEKIIRGLL
ncbi:MAG: hypothetical protein ABIJ18_00205 [archaeon]